MTLFKSTDGLVPGQPISPFFGAQFGAQCGANTPGPIVLQPPDPGNGGPTLTLLAALSTGYVPLNTGIGNVNGVVPSVASGIGQAQFSVATLMSTGTGGATTARGAAVPNQANNPSTGNINGAINQQIFVEGIGQGAMVNGPTAVGTSSLTETPLSGAAAGGAPSGTYLG